MNETHEVVTAQVKRLLERKRRSKARLMQRELRHEYTEDLATHALAMAKVQAEIEVLVDLLAGVD